MGKAMKRQDTKKNEIESFSTPIPLADWRRKVGISQVTAWRWAKRGWLRTINVAGRPYITPQAAQDFACRAEAGEFAKPPSGAAAAHKTRSMGNVLKEGV